MNLTSSNADGRKWAQSSRQAGMDVSNPRAGVDTRSASTSFRATKTKTVPAAGPARSRAKKSSSAK
jgi:hypothetical protein